MRMWHYALIKYLPDMQLLGQWSELGTIKSRIEKKGTPNHLLVNRVLDFPVCHFKDYSNRVYAEMTKRGMHPRIAKLKGILTWKSSLFNEKRKVHSLYRGWHSERYLRQCLYNLQEKRDSNGITYDEWKKITDKFDYMKIN